MTLATKLTLVLWAGILAVHSAAAVLRVDRENRLFSRDTAHDQQVLSRALSHAADRAWRNTGEAEAMAMLQHASDREHSMSIRWVWLEGASGFVPPQELRTWLDASRPPDKTSLTLHTAPGGEAAVVTYTLLRSPTGRLGAIEITDLLRAEKAYVWDSVKVAVITSAILAGLIALLAWTLLTRLVKRPVEQLVAHAQRVGTGDFAHCEQRGSEDEIAVLARAMNKMCDRLTESRDRAAAEARARELALEQLRHADRLKTIGTLASGIAHELGTPLNVVEGHAQLARETLPDIEVRAHLDVITGQCQRMAAIIRQLLDFSRRGRSKDVTCSLLPVVRETVSMMQPLARKSQITIAFAVSGSEDEARSQVALGPSQLQQVLVNVLINAVHAMPSGGTIWVSAGLGTGSLTDHASTEQGDTCFVEVRDSGTGMDQETIARIFEPFFTTKQVGEGTGLGLSVAYGIVRDVDGFIHVRSEPGQGATFTICLPLAERANLERPNPERASVDLDPRTVAEVPA